MVSDGMRRFYRSVARQIPTMIVGFPSHALLDQLLDEKKLVRLPQAHRNTPNDNNQNRRRRFIIIIDDDDEI